jgi:hypothetical protein
MVGEVEGGGEPPEVESVVLFKFKVVVKDDERAFLVRDGRFERLLGPGRFVALDYGRRLTSEVVKVARAEIAADKALLFAKAHPAVAAEHFEIVQVGPNEVAIVSLDGEPKHLVLPNTTRAFWKTITKVDVERIDATTEVRVAKRHLDKLDPARMPMVVQAQVDAHEAGLLFIDGKLTERLPAGRHAGGSARVLGGWPYGQDPEGRHASDAARGDGSGDPDQGSGRHPRDADGVHEGDRPGEGGAGGG